jgi:A/G-specific adenine glycosylase
VPRPARIVPSPPAEDARAEWPESRDLLVWYDRHRRDLPWRAKPGENPDPYRVWLSEIMLQQTTIAAVRPYFAAFLQRFPTLDALAAAPSEAVMTAWAGLGYYSRARNLHACARAVAAAGAFPDTEEGLRKLPGIGAYTAGAVAAIAFGRRAAAVDGNVERVATRVFAVEQPLPAAKAIVRDLVTAVVPADRPGDFAQALMDLGSTICTPKRPACALCPWMKPCRARAAGLQETFPRKSPKRTGELRRGAAFVALRDDDAILLRTREARVLLGGMAEPPTSAWRPDYDAAQAMLDAPLEARWRRLPGRVVHVFTHFPLELTVLFAKVAAGHAGSGRDALDAALDARRGAVAGAMRKVLAHAFAAVAIPVQPSAKRPQPSGPLRTAAATGRKGR